MASRLMTWVRHLWYRMLHPGRCMSCGAVLLDDTEDFYCSEQCHLDSFV